MKHTKKMTCPACEKGLLSKKKVDYQIYGVRIGTFPAQVCSSCKEQWFDQKTSERIEEQEKKKGLFGLSKRTKISYSGNSLIVRIPEQIVHFLGLKREEEVIIHPEGKNKLVVEI